jgi:hypothetical protein
MSGMRKIGQYRISNDLEPDEPTPKQPNDQTE